MLNTKLEKMQKKVDIVNLIRRISTKNILNNNEYSDNKTFFTTKCPFCDTKTNSFIMSREYQTYECRRCLKKGQAFDFIKHYLKNISDEKIIEILVKNSKIDISFSESKSVINELLIINFLHDFKEYSKNSLNKVIKNDKDDELLEYKKLIFEDTSLNKEDIKEYEIGFIWEYEIFNNFFESEKFDKFTILDKNKEGHLKEANNKKKKDWFKNRLIIPIKNLNNYTIGFVGMNIKNKKWDILMSNIFSLEEYDKTYLFNLCGFIRVHEKQLKKPNYIKIGDILLQIKKFNERIK